MEAFIKLCFSCGISPSYPCLSDSWVFTDEQMKVLFLQSVTQCCLGSWWPQNAMSDSLEGQPDFRLQQYLVAVMPHCTRCSQICIANSPLVDHNDNSGSTLLSMEDVVFMVS